MKIGVLSDTHSKRLPVQLIAVLEQVDLIIHVGDFCDVDDYEALTKYNKLEAVCGNMDCSELCTMLPQKKILDLEGFKIGLFHGRGAPHTVLNKAAEVFRQEKPDVVIFGHSHQPINKEIDGVLFFNPGSPNDKIFAPYCSYGIIELTPQGINAEIIKI